MRQRVRALCTTALAALALCGCVEVAAATASPTRPDIAGAVGQPITLEGEQIHTVLQVQRWYGGDVFVPRPGDAAITVRVRIRALKETACNPLWYALSTPEGTSYGLVALGGRAPMLGASNQLAPGTTVAGWLTFAVPLRRIGGLTLVYRMHAGFGPILRVRLGRVADSPTARPGQAVRLGGEQVQTVSEVARLPRLGVWVPKRGDVFVTVMVTVRALKATTVGGMYYALLASNGTWYRGPTLASQRPAFPWKAVLARGGTARGWITFMVPDSLAGSVTLVYHLPINRTDLLVHLPG